jgi:uncharacterized protein (TIGR00730 family)
MSLSVCVYCGSSSYVEPTYFQAAQELGHLLADHHFTLIYGGGRQGLMGAIANGFLEKKGTVRGFITEFLRTYEGTPNGIQLEVVETMHMRKLKMSEAADVFVILPGGFGTLDELFEIMTWKQLKLHHKPIFILNIQDYWTPLNTLMETVISHRFARPEHKNLVRFISTVPEVLQALQEMPRL